MGGGGETTEKQKQNKAWQKIGDSAQRFVALDASLKSDLRAEDRLSCWILDKRQAMCPALQGMQNETSPLSSLSEGISVWLTSLCLLGREQGLPLSHSHVCTGSAGHTELHFPESLLVHPGTKWGKMLKSPVLKPLGFAPRAPQGDSCTGSISYALSSLLKAGSNSSLLLHVPRRSCTPREHCHSEIASLAVGSDKAAAGKGD